MLGESGSSWMPRAGRSRSIRREHVHLYSARSLIRPAAVAAAVVLLAADAPGQTFRNVVNVPFRTVASGPMSVQIVDAPSVRSADADRFALSQAVMRARSRRDPAVARHVELMRRSLRYDGPLTPGVPDIVVMRRAGALDLPRFSSGRASGHELTFAFLPTGTPGGWTAAWETDLTALLNVLYAEMKNVYGDPAWSGTVKIINGDSLPAGQIISDPNALSGGVYNVSAGEITIPQNLSVQSAVLNLTQMLAIAFRGPAIISYDAWERGMARAATMMVLRNALPSLKSIPSAVFGGTLGDLYVYDPLWHALDRYDWLNQPALGNDRFFPASKQDGQANTPGFPNMLVPRLQMSGSAWLKVVTEAPGFLAAFNAAYYQALSADSGLRNRVPDLVTLAGQALSTAGGAGVEGLPFADWYSRQFVLDTSVAPGPKLYALTSALRPDGTDDDYALGVILMHYQTAYDALGNSDEVDLNATGYPIYRDYTFDNRLFLGAQYERVDIRNGIGTVAPTFFNTIGGEPGEAGRMRITMDFPVGSEAVRVEAAPRSSGTDAQPNTLWGVVVGADTGTIRLEADGISTPDIPVRQGAFGAVVDAALLSRPRRATLTFTDSLGAATQRKLITGVGEQVVVFMAESSVDTRDRTLPGGLAMVAFPIRPLQSRAADALRDPSSGAPLFDDGTLLMARWRQNMPGEDKYARYPAMEPVAPGKGYWISLPQPTTVRLTGRLASRDRDVTVGLQYGWNQIGNPYESQIPASSLQFQYMADNVPADLQTAVARGWVVAHTIPGVGQSALWGYSPAAGYVPIQTLDSWSGCWIRVLVSEGLTLTYPSPVAQGAKSPARSVSVSGTRAPMPRFSWAIRMTVTDGAGRGASGVFGQVPGAAQGLDAEYDAPSPPGFLPELPQIGFDIGEGQAGGYYSDIRAVGDRSPWRITVRTPNPNGTYTLRWSQIGTVPRSTRLSLVDTATGQRRYLHAASSYQFAATGSGTRVFEVIPELRGAGACRIMNLRAEQSRSTGGRSVSVAFDLSASATVTAHITDAAGRSVRRLAQGRASGTGSQSMVWDTRDDRGVSLPAGAYSVVITARTPEGDMARAIVPVVLVR